MAKSPLKHPVRNKRRPLNPHGSRMSNLLASKEQRQAAALAHLFADGYIKQLERMQLIIDLLPCYVMVISADRSLQYYNRAFVHFFGKNDCQTCYGTLRGQDTPCAHCSPLETLQSNTSHVTEWVHQETNRAFRVYSYPFTEKDGTKLLLKVGFNITANVRVQHALDFSKQSYKVITDNLSIGIAMLDVNLHITTGNKRLTGWFSHNFQLEKRICELLECWGDCGRPEPTAMCPHCPFHAALNDGISHEKEFSLLLPQGRERRLRLVACPVAPRPGLIQAFIAMVEDITNRIEVNQQLQHAKKLEAMSTLAGGIAHEINQPLSALHLYASGLQILLEKQQALPVDTTKQRLSLIMQEAEKIRSIIAHMRSLVMKKGDVPKEAVPVERAVTNTLTILLQQLQSRSITVQTNLPSTLPPVICNSVQLEQIFINLLSNAIHALAKSKNGTGSTTGLQIAKSPLISIAATITDDKKAVCIEIADNGPGLANNSEQLFDPFYTTKEAHQSMGLGLSITHGLVTLWGGTISARQHHQDLGGAAFYITLPAATEENTDTPQS